MMLSWFKDSFNVLFLNCGLLPRMKKDIYFKHHSARSLCAHDSDFPAQCQDRKLPSFEERVKVNPDTSQ